jgi:hypothetical protein
LRLSLGEHAPPTMTEPGNATHAQARWAVLIALCAGQFVMVLDDREQDAARDRHLRLDHRGAQPMRAPPGEAAAAA